MLFIESELLGLGRWNKIKGPYSPSLAEASNFGLFPLTTPRMLLSHTTMHETLEAKIVPESEKLSILFFVLQRLVYISLLYSVFGNFSLSCHMPLLPATLQWDYFHCLPHITKTCLPLALFHHCRFLITAVSLLYKMANLYFTPWTLAELLWSTASSHIKHKSCSQKHLKCILYVSLHT